ncbi:MAG: MotA/TolQ/ExbB proton channel family protein [Oscillospiraceae bacterium]|nr:MotA/TolQ/ExbB proton channel family protein [Oscillospiraceae bacterium]
MTSAVTDKSFSVGDVLRAVATAMNIPVIVILIIFLLCAAALIGWILAEYFSERRHMKISLPALLEELNRTDDLTGAIEASGLLRRQKDALKELASHPDFSPELRESLAVRLLDAEQARYARIVHVSELLSRLAPMFGLLGTLIPLGPGIIALGQGDTFTLSSSMLTAFDTTIAGLLAAAVAMVVSAVRRSWYRDYNASLEALAQCVLDRCGKEQP